MFIDLEHFCEISLYSDLFYSQALKHAINNADYVVLKSLVNMPNLFGELKNEMELLKGKLIPPRENQKRIFSLLVSIFSDFENLVEPIGPDPSPKALECKKLANEWAEVMEEYDEEIKLIRKTERMRENDNS